jgi:esterase/lipase
MMKALRFIKDNLFAVGALCGALIAAIFAYGTSGSKKVAELVLKNKSESEKSRLQMYRDTMDRQAEFEDLEKKILSDAKRKEEEITKEQEETLAKRKKEYLAADTFEERKKVVEDIKRNFGKLNYAPLDSIATVEKKDD